jgi:hypothetical protein
VVLQVAQLVEVQVAYILATLELCTLWVVLEEGSRLVLVAVDLEEDVFQSYSQTNPCIHTTVASQL